ncbi:MAG: hypothetical protein M3O26_07740 [Pseudomonadota bacterium]|nr:hypothetical protein [Pseudomonadota bacterium]
MCERAFILGVGAAAACLLCAGAVRAQAASAQISAEPPSDLIVTVYRAPYRHAGSVQLDALRGFALVSETRTVRLPAGLSQVRFEGVADGIEPASAIITGFPGGVVEKNRDAKLLSPGALLAATVGKPVEMLRTIRKSGKTERLSGTILSDAGGGVVFQSTQGIEALRCSGLPEAFSFEPVSALSAKPTLSVEVRSPAAVTTQITLSYLSRGFDWAADYTATLEPGGKSIDLGAWVTLANSNGVGFPSAHTQVVAGRVSRESGEVEPIEFGGPIFAMCWPRGTTSEPPMILFLGEPRSEMLKKSMRNAPAPMAAGALQEMVLTGATKVEQEQLGDLKLYRVPERTTVSSRQSKQVRLMDRISIPVTTVYAAESSKYSESSAPAHRLLRTKNTTANHLGLPLPAGSIAVFGSHQGERLLVHESDMRDIAVGEEVEIDAGLSADVRVTVINEQARVDSEHAKMLPLVPGLSLRSVKMDDIERVEISNASATGIQFELKLQLPEGGRVLRADHPLGTKNGRPLFRLKVPANQTLTVRFQTQRVDDGILRTP